MLLALALIVTSGTAISSSTASPKTQWAPTGPCAPLHARAVFSRETSAAARPCAGEQPAIAAGEKDWSYASNNPLLNVDPDGRRGDRESINDAVNVACGSSSERCSPDLRSAVYRGEVRANGVAAIGTAAVMCLLAPGCREAALAGAKAAGTVGSVAYGAAYLAGLKGHREDGSFIETIPNPVSGAMETASECSDLIGQGDWFNGPCVGTALVVLPVARGAISAAARTNTARALVLRVQLATADIAASEEAALAGGTTGPWERPGLATVTASRGQEGPYTCGVACVREIIRRRTGRNISESTLLESIGLKQTPKGALNAEQLQTILNEHLSSDWKSGVNFSVYDV